MTYVILAKTNTCQNYALKESLADCGAVEQNGDGESWHMDHHDNLLWHSEHVCWAYYVVWSLHNSRRYLSIRSLLSTKMFYKKSELLVMPRCFWLCAGPSGSECLILCPASSHPQHSWPGKATREARPAQPRAPESSHCSGNHLSSISL